MAVSRNIQMSFWTDSKVYDDFTPEDKYFYLYLLTNPHTNLLGCFEISVKTMSNETGYSADVIEKLLDRFENIHKVLRYSHETKEVLLLHWYKYNWQGGNQKKNIEVLFENVKNDEFKDYISDVMDMVDNPLQGAYEGLQGASCSTIYINNKYIDSIKNIIEYLNSVCNTNYKYNTKATQKQIIARLKEGYTEDDFKSVIDKKYKEWIGTDYEKYLRPDTLFGSKFESYINQKILDTPYGMSRETAEMRARFLANED